MTIEELQQQLLEAQDKMKEKDELITNLTTENNDYKSKIASLQEHNQRLFLRLQTGPAEDHQEEPPAPPTYEETAMKYKGVIN